MINNHINKDVSSIIKKYFLILIPLYLYGIYKNFFLLINQSFKFELIIFNPIILPLIGLGIGLLINYIDNKHFKINSLSLYGFMIGMTMPPSINPILFIFVLFIILYILNKFTHNNHFNVPAFIILIIYIIGLLINKTAFANVLETSNLYNYSLLDKILGNQIGGIATSSLAILLIAYLFINFDFYFKKEIAISSVLSFVIVTAITIIFRDSLDVVNLLINSTVYFPLLFISSISEYSPMRTKTKIFYGSIIGIFTAILCIILNCYLAPYISILLFSTLYLNIDKLKPKKHIKK